MFCRRWNWENVCVDSVNRYWQTMHSYSPQILWVVKTCVQKTGRELLQCLCKNKKIPQTELFMNSKFLRLRSLNSSYQHMMSTGVQLFQGCICCSVLITWKSRKEDWPWLLPLISYFKSTRWFLKLQPSNLLNNKSPSTASLGIQFQCEVWRWHKLPNPYQRITLDSKGDLSSFHVVKCVQVKH